MNPFNKRPGRLFEVLWYSKTTVATPRQKNASDDLTSTHRTCVIALYDHM
jgi:hypothetical protein